jgi:MFS family permease
MVFAPFGGKVLDKWGRKGSFMFFMCFTALLCCIWTIVLIRQHYTEPNYLFMAPIVI